MEELFLNKDHFAKLSNIMGELGFVDMQDLYRRSLSFIIAGNDKLFSNQHSLVNFDQKKLIVNAGSMMLCL